MAYVYLEKDNAFFSQPQCTLKMRWDTIYYAQCVTACRVFIRDSMPTMLVNKLG